jgi:hypothetical protein
MTSSLFEHAHAAGSHDPSAWLEGIEQAQQNHRRRKLTLTALANQITQGEHKRP